MKTLLVLCLLFSQQALSKLKVVTSTTNLKALVNEVGRDKVEVSSFSKGSQDPHFLEAKPSFMVKASQADLLVQIGLGLEEGWLPLIIRGARNPKIRPGEKGHFFASVGVDLLEVSDEVVTRAKGDVHPEGNPHFMLDPIRASVVAEKLAKKLSSLDSKNTDFYFENAKSFKKEMLKIVNAGKRILTNKNKKIITYHKTLNYFNERFSLKNLAYLEPKPGVPPTASHIIKVIKIAKNELPKHILIENYFDPSVGKRVINGLKKSELHIVPVAVEGRRDINNLKDLYISLLKTVADEEVWKY